MKPQLVDQYAAARRRNPLVPAAEILSRIKAGDRCEMLGTRSLLADAEAVIGSLLHQIEQMQGLFDDADHSIADAVTEASEVQELLACFAMRGSPSS